MRMVEVKDVLVWVVNEIEGIVTGSTKKSESSG